MYFHLKAWTLSAIFSLKLPIQFLNFMSNENEIKWNQVETTQIKSVKYIK